MGLGRNGSHFNHGKRGLGHSRAQSKGREKVFGASGAAEDPSRDSELRYRENAVERRIEAVVEILDPWFYVFEGVRSPTAEIILFPLAPLLGFMGGLILMVFTPWGELRVFARFLLCGFLGCFVAVTTAFLVRQPGGIATGMVCYSAVLGFVVSSLVGVLRPFWFTETVRGRKPGEKFTRRSLAEVKG